MRVLIEAPSEPALRLIGDGLAAFNAQVAGTDLRPTEFVSALRADSGDLLGGLRCDLYLGGLHIEWAWLASSVRRQGYGRQLVQAAERHALGLGAQMAHLDTFTFQSRTFYERCGYEVFGVLAYPGAVRRFYMHKALRRDPDGREP